MQTDPNPLILTDAAATKVAQLITEEGKPELSLRVYIVGGGCSGFQYGFAFDAKRNPDDIVISKSGVNLVVDALSLQYLMGAQIDYKESLQGSHFVVSNPNAATTCGCGSSFAPK